MDELDNVLVDADFLVALFKKDDSNHQRAVALSQRYQKTNLYLSPLSIPEAATVISHWVSQEAAKNFLRVARKRKITDLSLTPELEKETDAIFLKQTKKGISWPDCLNVALARKYSIKYIFSFDKFYSRNGLLLVSELDAED